MVTGETPNLKGDFIGETNRVLEHTQNQPHVNQHQKGPICVWMAAVVTESQQRDQQVAFIPLRHPSHIQCHNVVTVGCPALANT